MSGRPPSREGMQARTAEFPPLGAAASPARPRSNSQPFLRAACRPGSASPGSPRPTSPAVLSSGRGTPQSTAGPATPPPAPVPTYFPSRGFPLREALEAGLRRQRSASAGDARDAGLSLAAGLGRLGSPSAAAGSPHPPTPLAVRRPEVHHHQHQYYRATESSGLMPFDGPGLPSFPFASGLGRPALSRIVSVGEEGSSSSSSSTTSGAPTVEAHEGKEGPGFGAATVPPRLPGAFRPALSLRRPAEAIDSGSAAEEGEAAAQAAAAAGGGSAPAGARSVTPASVAGVEDRVPRSDGGGAGCGGGGPRLRATQLLPHGTGSSGSPSSVITKLLHNSYSLSVTTEDDLRLRAALANPPPYASPVVIRTWFKPAVAPHRYDTHLRAALHADAIAVLSSPNQGGNSENSEALSLEILHALLPWAGPADGSRSGSAGSGSIANGSSTPVPALFSHAAGAGLAPPPPGFPGNLGCWLLAGEVGIPYALHSPILDYLAAVRVAGYSSVNARRQEAGTESMPVEAEEVQWWPPPRRAAPVEPTSDGSAPPAPPPASSPGGASHTGGSYRLPPNTIKVGVSVTRAIKYQKPGAHPAPAVPPAGGSATPTRARAGSAASVTETGTPSATGSSPRSLAASLTGVDTHTTPTAVPSAEASALDGCDAATGPSRAATPTSTPTPSSTPSSARGGEPIVDAPPGTFSLHDAGVLLHKKLRGLHGAAAGVDPAFAWDRSVLHIFAESEAVATKLQEWIALAWEAPGTGRAPPGVPQPMQAPKYPAAHAAALVAGVGAAEGAAPLVGTAATHWEGIPLPFPPRAQASPPPSPPRPQQAAGGSGSAAAPAAGVGAGAGADKHHHHHHPAPPPALPTYAAPQLSMEEELLVWLRSTIIIITLAAGDTRGMWRILFKNPETFSPPVTYDSGRHSRQIAEARRRRSLGWF